MRYIYAPIALVLGGILGVLCKLIYKGSPKKPIIHHRERVPVENYDLTEK